MPSSWIKYLTIVVQDQVTHEWEVMIEDIRLEAPSEKGVLASIGEWVAIRGAVYPAEQWLAWTLVTDNHGQWRAAFARQNNAPAPLSSVRPANHRASG